MNPLDVEEVAALQADCFPPPFPPELLWQASHLLGHLRLFPQGQFVAVVDGKVVGSASSLLIPSERWAGDHSWDDVTGGLTLSRHDPKGTLLYGADISVHPEHRGQGIARALYQARFDLVRRLSLKGFVTSCRLPGFLASNAPDPETYAQEASRGERTDATLTPLLKMGLSYLGVSRTVMDDPESGNAAAKLEWLPC
jgi:GNAT superfamily N-acetyltransferase